MALLKSGCVQAMQKIDEKICKICIEKHLKIKFCTIF